MKRNRVNVIYWALVLSLLAHASLAPLAQHLKVVEAAKDQAPEIIRLVRHRKPPPPAPKPTPKPRTMKQPPPRATAPAAARPVHLPPTSKSGPRDRGATHRPIAYIGTNPSSDDPGPGDGVATSSPEPTPTPKPVCAAPLVDASTIEKYTPEMPAAARDAGLSGTTQVKVDLSASGTVLDASVAVSSGSTMLDVAAIQAAKRTTYAPKIVDCQRVPGSYLFRVEFSDH